MSYHYKNEVAESGQKIFFSLALMLLPFRNRIRNTYKSWAREKSVWGFVVLSLKTETTPLQPCSSMSYNHESSVTESGQKSEILSLALILLLFRNKTRNAFKSCEIEIFVCFSLGGGALEAPRVRLVFTKFRFLWSREIPAPSPRRSLTVFLWSGDLRNDL